MAETFITTLIPSEIRFPPGKLLTVSDAPLLDILGVYEDDPQGFKIPRGLRIVTSGDFANMGQAEEFARQLSMTWMAMMCFTMGVKASLPRVERVLQRIDKSGRYRLRLYDYQAMHFAASRELEVDALTKVQHHLVGLPQNELDRVALAVRWYTVGISEPDDVNRFLAHWIGLEAIGDLLHNRIHKFDRAPCTVCDHPAGRDHNGSAGGMKHALAVVSGRPELHRELDTARDRLFHGLDDIQVHAETVRMGVGSLEKALGRAILEVLKPQGEDAASVLEPLPASETTPHVIFDGTLIDLTDAEREDVVYRQNMRIFSEIESGRNEADGELILNVKLGMNVPETLIPRLVDQRPRVVSAPGVIVRLTH